MTVIHRRISSGHHTGIWKQQPRWLVIDIWTHRIEVIW